MKKIEHYKGVAYGDCELSPGHFYRIKELDGGGFQFVRFVKREGPGYPGNVGHSPGINLQKVFKMCTARLAYLNGQIPCAENVLIQFLLRLSMWLLEFRTARRRGYLYLHTPRYAMDSPLCETCGHTDCKESH